MIRESIGWGSSCPGHCVGLTSMAVSTASVCSSFGQALAPVCRTRKQLVAISELVVLSIPAFGGSMFPRFLMPESLRRFSLATFNPEIAVLLAWASALYAIALWSAPGCEAISRCVVGGAKDEGSKSV